VWREARARQPKVSAVEELHALLRWRHRGAIVPLTDATAGLMGAAEIG